MSMYLSLWEVLSVDKEQKGYSGPTDPVWK